MKMFSNNYPISFVIFIITTYLVSQCLARCNQGFCHETCNEEFPCNNQVIDFSSATAGSLLDCQSANTCINITLKCPHIASTNIALDRHNCEIRGDGGIFESHNNWTIYAPDSFNDLTITNFNVYVSGKMYCDHDSDYNSSCSMQYGLWNCEYSQFDNKCFRSKTNEEYINCTVAGQCETKTLSCSDIADGENEGVCNVVCSGFESCASTTINCGARRACNVLCTGERSCIGLETKTNINCGAGTLENCTIICGSSASSASCVNMNINSGDLRGDLNVNGMGEMVLNEAVVFGPDYGDVNIQCNANQSCQNATFYANNSIKLSIGCNGNDGVCQDIHVYCPTKSQNCVISGSANDKQLDLQIFARGGWSDIDITDEYKTNSEIDIDGESTQSRMHCGVHDNYDASCVINTDWFCQCPVGPTISPTSHAPTSQYDITTSISVPDDSDELSDREKNGYIVGGVFVGFVVACFFCVVYWYCCVHHKAVDNINSQHKKQHYQTVTSYEEDVNVKDDIELIEMDPQTSIAKKGIKDEKESKQMENVVVEDTKEEIDEEENKSYDV